MISKREQTILDAARELHEAQREHMDAQSREMSVQCDLMSAQLDTSNAGSREMVARDALAIAVFMLSEKDEEAA